MFCMASFPNYHLTHLSSLHNNTLVADSEPRPRPSVTIIPCPGCSKWRMSSFSSWLNNCFSGRGRCTGNAAWISNRLGYFLRKILEMKQNAVLFESLSTSHVAGPDWCTGSLFVGFLQMLTDLRSAEFWFPGEAQSSDRTLICLLRAYRAIIMIII